MLRRTFLTLMAASAFVLPVLSFTAKNASAEELAITITNGTGASLQQLYISPAGTDDWSGDLLGSDTVEPGDTVQISVSDDGQCVYDIRSVFDDGSTLDGRGDLCELNGNSYTISDQ